MRITPAQPHARTPVAVLGATGAVGQTFVRLLENHPWFELAQVAASERSAGRRYGDVTRWIEGAMPRGVAELLVSACDPARVRTPIVFSALDASVASEIEPAFAKAGAVVLSNAKSHRMDADVPLVIPEVNGGQLEIIAAQRAARGWPGAIITNANCAATVAAMALAPLHASFELRRVFVATMQAVSGAGYPGVPSLDILGNVIPHIGEEEEKIERELPKLLGTCDGRTIRAGEFTVSAHANRVPVEHGHTTCISAEFARRPSVSEAVEALRCWTGHPGVKGLPSAPERAVYLMEGADRPQPRRDVQRGGGMTVSVGRVREDPQMHIRLVALGHNTVRGAAGGSILNAELLVHMGLLSTHDPRLTTHGRR